MPRRKIRVREFSRLGDAQRYFEKCISAGYTATGLVSDGVLRFRVLPAKTPTLPGFKESLIRIENKSK